MTISGNNHPSRDDLSAYALGALDSAETRAIQEHLRSCLDCQAILEGYQQVATGLLFATPPQSPSPQLRARLAAQISTSSGSQVRAAQPRRQAAPSRWLTRLLPVALALAVIILLVIDLGLVQQVRGLQEQQQALLSIIHANQDSLAAVSQPGASLIGVAGTQGAGNLVVSPDGKTAVLFLQKLPVLDQDHTYQVWLIPAAGSPLSAGLFQAQAGQATTPVIISSQQPLSSFSKIGITVEPRGGSKGPTTTPILLGNL